MMAEEIEYENPKLDTQYDFVCILDGLSSCERNQYKISSTLNSIFESNDLPSCLSEPNSSQELFEELDKLEILASEGKRFLIHVVAHGDKLGIQIGNDCVDWPDLLLHLQSIHQKTGNSLILNMSTCKGLYGARIVPPDGCLPFFGIIGAKEDLAVQDALNANKIMYKKWLKDVPVQKMVPETNSELGKELLFNLSAEGYRKLALKKIT
jgi:hypothetical protein